MNQTLQISDMIHLLCGGTIVLKPSTKRIALADTGRAAIDRALDSAEFILEVEGNRIGQERAPKQ